MTTLPVHPTLRHPLTGEPIHALYIDKNGRARFPIMGGDETADAAAATAKAAEDAAAKATEDAAAKAAEDAKKGGEFGFPKDTPVAEMTAEQQAAYWRHNAQKHEGRYKSLVGQRSYDQAKADLAAFDQVQREQQTPAEQAINDARDEGKKAGLTAARQETASTVFRGHLEAAQIPKDDVDDLVANFNVTTFVTDDGVDTTKIANFAKRFTPSGKDTPRTRNFGGGQRPEPSATRGAGGKAEAQKRFHKNKTGE